MYGLKRSRSHNDVDERDVELYSMRGESSVLRKVEGGGKVG